MEKNGGHHASFSTTGSDKLFYSALGTRVMPTHNIEQGIMRVRSFELKYHAFLDNCSVKHKKVRRLTILNCCIPEFCKNCIEPP